MQQVYDDPKKFQPVELADALETEFNPRDSVLKEIRVFRIVPYFEEYV